MPSYCGVSSQLGVCGHLPVGVPAAANLADQVAEDFLSFCSGGPTYLVRLAESLLCHLV